MKPALASLTGAFVATMLMWVTLTPMFSAPDEAAHLSSAYRMATAPAWPDPGEARIPGAVIAAMERGGLGRAENRATWNELEAASPGLSTSVDWMTQHPPLYYAIAGGVLSITDLEDRRWDHSIVTLRLLSIAMLVPLPALLYLTVFTLTRSRRAGLVAAAAPLVIPQLPFIGASVSNDPLVITLSAAATWLIARVIMGRRDAPTLVGLGLAIAVLALTKGTGLTVVPFAAIALLLTGRETYPLLSRVRDTVVVFAIGALGLWWWVANVIRFGTIQPSGTEGLRPEVPWDVGDGPDAAVWLNGLWNGVTQSFWGNFGALSIPMLSAVTEILSVGMLLLVGFWAFRRPTRSLSLMLSVHAFTILVLLARTVWSVYDRTQFIYGVQGRYFFVALASLAALAAIAALQAASTPESRRRILVAVAVSAPVFTAYSLAISFAGFYRGERGGFSISREALGVWSAVTPFGLVSIGLAALLLAGSFFWAASELIRQRHPSRSITYAGGPTGN